MTTLAAASTVIGGAVALMGAFLAAMPGRARELMRGFPRHRGAGAALTAVALLWAGWLLYQMPLGSFDRYKPLVFALVPIAFVLMVFCVDELLAVRALGGLLLLIPAPLLDAARWHPSSARYVILVLAYAMVIKGMALVLSPYLFRKATERLLGTDFVCRLWGGCGLAFGLLLAGLGLLVY